MIEKTTFSKKELQTELNKKYGINVEKIEKINKGTANIFKIISNNEKFIVKEFQSKYSKENVLKEINSIEYLRKNSQVPLPIYLKNNNNELYFVHKGKMIVVQKFVEGQVFEKNKGNHEQILESARYLGLIIEGFKNYNIDDNISILDWYSNKEFEKANKKYDEILSKLDNSKISEKIKMDIIFKKELLAKLNKNINAEDIKNITHKVSHGDYSVLQFIYDNEDNIRVILDFIKTKKLPIVWEIARSYSYIDKDAKDGKIDVDNLVEYTKKVAEFTELNEYDLKYLPYVYLIQLARSTFGYSEYFKNIENKDDMEEVKEELVDRFSDVPRSVQTLLYIAYIKSMCKKLKIERVTQNQNEISLVPLTRYKTKEKIGYKIVNELVDLLEKMCKLNEK